MAVIRQSYQSDNVVNYVGTIGVFLAISCTIVMLRFKGFKAVLNLSGKPREAGAVDGIVSSVSIRGAYRANTYEFVEYGTLTQSPNSRITTSMVKLPPSQNLRPTKSVSDITQAESAAARSNAPERPTQTQSTTNVSKQKSEKNNQISKKDKQKADKLEKEKLAAQKKRDKIAANDQAKQDKLRRERERKQAKEAKKRDKDIPPAPQAPKPSNNPLAQTQTNSTNRLESSISKSTGPPPYDEVPKTTTKNNKDTSGNTSFGKPVEDDSWDLVSKHREQMVRPTSDVGGGRPRQTVLDLQFQRMGQSSRRPSDDSEADA